MENYINFLIESEMDFLNHFCYFLKNKLVLKSDKVSFVYLIFTSQTEFSDLSKKYLNKNSSDTLTINHQEKPDDKYSSFIYINPLFIYKCFEEKFYFENTSKEGEKSFCLFLIERISHSIVHSLGYDHKDNLSNLKMFKKEKEIIKLFL